MEPHKQVEKVYVLGPQGMAEDFDKAFENIFKERSWPFHNVEFL